MNIAWLIPEIPIPTNTGGRNVIFNRIKYLSKTNNIFLFCITDTATNKETEEDLLLFCKSANLYNRNRNKVSNVLKALFLPYSFASRTIPKLTKDLKRTFVSNSIDLIICEFPQMIYNIPTKRPPNTKLILNQHNIEYLSLKSNMNNRIPFFKKIILLFESKRTEIAEYFAYNFFNINLYTFVSTEDMFHFSQKNKSSNITLSPIGSEIPKTINSFNKNKNIIFVGKMSYMPNEIGIIWFITKILPIIIKEIPDVKLYIVGKDPSNKLLEYRSSNIYITGTVPSIEEYYNITDLVIIPLRSGGGVKVKLIEALSKNKIVVTTTKGIEGTIFTNGTDVLATDDIKLFGKYCIDVLTDPDQYIKLIASSNDKIIKNYSWENICDKYNKTIINLFSKKE